MIAIAVMTAISALAYPTVAGGLRRQKLIDATDEVMALVEFAHVQARSRNRAYVLEVNPTAGSQQHGVLSVYEASTARCSSLTDPLPSPIRQLDLNVGDFKDIKVTATLPVDLSSSRRLCFTPEGRLLDTSTSQPFPATNTAYGAGEAHIYLRRVDGSTPVDTTHRIIVSYQGLPRFEHAQ